LSVDYFEGFLKTCHAVPRTLLFFRPIFAIICWSL
jgi:hypothetical protein